MPFSLSNLLRVPKMRSIWTGKRDALLPRRILRMIFFTLFCKVAECRAGGGEAVPRFSPSLPTYLPVSCSLQGAESTFFLREATQEVMLNSSLHTRIQPFFLHLPEGGAGAGAFLSVNCSYGNLTAEAAVPPELLLQRGAPRQRAGSSSLPAGWKVRAHVVARSVAPRRPRVQVLFYLAGRRWDEADPPAELLPCVRLVGSREPGEGAGAVSASCRLQGGLGVCVALLGIPAAWFSPTSSRRRGQESPTPSVELYYTVLPPEGGGGECLEGGVPRRGTAGEALRDMQSLGSVMLLGDGVKEPSGSRMRLDQNVEVVVPTSPVRQGQTVSFQILMNTQATVEQFTLRALYGEGITFMVVKPSNLAAWEIKQEVAPGTSSLSVLCQRKPSSADERLEGSFYEVMWVDFEIDNFINLRSSLSVRWQIEYQQTGAGEEIPSTIHISQRNIQGIVPLAEDTEILNTAILTGRRVSMPVRLVSVEEDGTVHEVDDPITCSSSDEDVLKVSPGCEEVLVNGKEMRGHQSVRVTFNYLYLTSDLEMTVWVPRLPLQIDVSDAELSQVKGWRVPIFANKRPTRDSEDDEDEERKGRGCALQYQWALVRVLTHFVAEPAAPGTELAHMLGADWQADITELVLDYLKVDDERIARLHEGRVLIGRDLGITTIQVLSPLSDSILAEKTVTVLDDKVSITDLGVQLVASLSVSLQPSPTHSRAIYITSTAQDLLHTPKQEAVISAWIQFSDGAVMPLDIFDPRDFTLTATSLDEAVVSTYQEQPQRWPVVVAEGEGQGWLVRVEMVISETCQKSKRKSVLAMGVGNVQVKFGQNDVEPRGKGHNQEEPGSDLDNSTSEQGQKLPEADKTGPDNWKLNSATLDREEGASRKVSTTTKTVVTQRTGGSGSQAGRGKAADLSIPAQVELPGQGGSEGDRAQSPRGLSDLEIGMYALLGVFCLAILVFLINCVSFAFRYRHKQLPVLEQGNMNHAHDWVWLGNEADLLDCHGGIPTPAPRDECTTAIDRSESYEESKYLLNGSGGGAGGAAGSVHCPGLPRTLSQDPRACMGQDTLGKNEPLNNSPSAAKRKRVKFTSYATVLPDEGGGPYNNSILVGNEDDIKWVCQDMDLGQSAELRTYMERLQDNL